VDVEALAREQLQSGVELHVEPQLPALRLDRLRMQLLLRNLAVFARLPKGSFKAHDVRKLVPGGVAPGTLSQRLTGWVKEKKLKRTGSRRGTRYTKVG